MKLIATTKTGYLAEVSETEVANLLGYSSTYDDGYRTLQRNYPDENLTGLEIEIERMHDVAKMLRNLTQTDIAKARQTLRYTQEKIDELQDIVDKLTLFETLKEA